jgi:predicted GNAT superfamily acetyltransferase
MTVMDIVIRDISEPAELRAVEELQKEAWGLRDLDVVPLSQLVAAIASGGILIGAFDDEILTGFVYGFRGYDNGQATHHSHMLAVRPDYRGLDIGYKLKLEQRRRAMSQGLDHMTWTFDPLQSLNAYLNFNKLGVISDRYSVNFYGEDAASFLHRNGTDRLWITWLLTSRQVVERLDGGGQHLEIENRHSLVEVGTDRAPRHVLNEGLSHDQVGIEIPADITALEQESRELASRWREITREAFTQAFAAGYLIDGFYRGVRNGQKIGRYLLNRRESHLLYETKK